jgi:hypothetical protein
MDFQALLESVGIVFAILLGMWGLLRGIRRDREAEVKERIQRATKINSICNKLDRLTADVTRVWAQVENHIPTMLTDLDTRLTAVERKVDSLVDRE